MVHLKDMSTRSFGASHTMHMVHVELSSISSRASSYGLMSSETRYAMMVPQPVWALLKAICKCAYARQVVDSSHSRKAQAGWLPGAWKVHEATYICVQVSDLAAS